MTLYLGNCLDVMPTLPANSVDSIITDPPYGLEFMGKDWDKGVPGIRFWTEALRVAKPGATLLAMGGTRTFHRLVCAIEDAGWEVFDTIAWLYGSGFPKSHDISKAMDKKAGAEREAIGRHPNARNTLGNIQICKKNGDGMLRPNPATPEAQEWHGWGTALKPAMELICVAQKPREGTYVNNALTWGVAGMWIDGARVEYEEGGDAASNPLFREQNGYKMPCGIDKDPVAYNIKRTPHKSVAVSSGRWPANVIHDGSDEVVGLMPETNNKGHFPKEVIVNNPIQFTGSYKQTERFMTDSGSAARFFYCAKASRSERNAGLEGITNGHPCVKPISLISYLCRLTKTPTGGIVLDPFMGSGTTGIAAHLSGREFIGIEMDAEYFEIARRRIEHWQAKPVQEELL